MQRPFWFNRMLQYWSVPPEFDLVDLVERAQPQVVQMGSFGPVFYSLADTEYYSGIWLYMPVKGIQEGLDYWKELIPKVQERGAKVIGQFSFTYHYGEYEQRLGWFAAWDRIWVPELLGKAPCENATDGYQVDAEGKWVYRTIEGRPWGEYIGCPYSPCWLAILKSMVTKALTLGLDGFNVYHNFVNFCWCEHCQRRLSAHLMDVFPRTTLKRVFGVDDLKDWKPAGRKPAGELDELQSAVWREIHRYTQIARKEAFDEVFIEHGRGIKPDLILAQWYHKYRFSPRDERCMLPVEKWAKDEDYIWYSQGPPAMLSDLTRGFMADTTLAAKYIYAAGGGKPFVCNKYDRRRWRMSMAEAAVHHATALGVHWPPDGEIEALPVETYLSSVIRY